MSRKLPATEHATEADRRDLQAAIAEWNAADPNTTSVVITPGSPAQAKLAAKAKARGNALSKRQKLILKHIANLQGMEIRAWAALAATFN